MPLSLFGAVMGMAGLGLAWRKAALALGAPLWIGESLLAGAALLFVLLAAAYGLKIARAADLVREEARDLRRFCFIACVPMSLMLLSAGALPFSTHIATVFWITGASAHLIVALIVLTRWIGGENPRDQLSPALFLPLAGIVIGAAVGAPLGFIELSWLMFAIGIILWPVVMALLFERLFFGAKPRDDEWPLLAIFITPPALAFMSYCELQQHRLDPFSHILFYAAVFFLLANVARAAVYRRLPYSLAWWAFTFPAAAVTNAALQYRAIVGAQFPIAFCVFLLALSSGLVFYNILQSARGLRAGSLLKLREIPR